jgi:hypothetical protein
MCLKKIILSLFLCSGCFTALQAQYLLIKIYNKTGYDLDSVSIGNIYAGKIEKDASTPFLKCDPVSMRDELPFGTPEGVIPGLARDSKPWRATASLTTGAVQEPTW